MKPSQEQYPELNQIMGGYFHQDWIDFCEERGESAVEETVLNQMLRDSNASEREAAVRELERLLASTTSDESLRDIIVDDMGAQVKPQLEGMTMREWLEHVADLLRKA